MTANEMRQNVVDEYRKILGRNKYSQILRAYCYKKYKDGKYYSDCSSSTALSYKEAGYPIHDKAGNTCPNTVGMMQSPDLQDVDVKIRDGIIQNPTELRVGDLLLFAGTDASRAYAGYAGHVEMIYRMGSAGKITICGHGSGTPRTTEMNAYCRSRFKQKTSKTKLGHKGLIAVKRRIADDGQDGQPTQKEEKKMGKIMVTGATVNLRDGAGTQYPIAKVVRQGDVLESIEAENGWVPVVVDGRIKWISEKYVKKVEDKR